MAHASESLGVSPAPLVTVKRPRSLPRTAYLMKDTGSGTARIPGVLHKPPGWDKGAPRTQDAGGGVPAEKQPHPGRVSAPRRVAGPS